jgi:hypothetical protein
MRQSLLSPAFIVLARIIKSDTAQMSPGKHASEAASALEPTHHTLNHANSKRERGCECTSEPTVFTALT